MKVYEGKLSEEKFANFFYDISNLLTTFQMSYIYHEVKVLA